MKLPNFRLYETQATASVYLGLFAWVWLAILAVFVLKGFDWKDKIIPYNAELGISRFRPYIVMGSTAVAVLLGLVAGILGFRSLGQKRNARQTQSWLGLVFGAMAVSLAPILFGAWKLLSEAIISRAA